MVFIIWEKVLSHGHQVISGSPLWSLSQMLWWKEKLKKLLVLERVKESRYTLCITVVKLLMWLLCCLLHALSFPSSSSFNIHLFPILRLNGLWVSSTVVCLQPFFLWYPESLYLPPPHFSTSLVFLVVFCPPPQSS